MINRMLIVAIILLLPLPIFSQTEIKQNQLVTYGTATLNFAPDRVRFSFGVRGAGSTLEEATKQATDRVIQITSKLKAVGVTEPQMQTSYFNSADNPEGKSWWSSSKDFAAAYEMTVTIDSVFDLVEPAIAALSGEPVEHLSRLEYSLRDDPSKRLEACIAAAKDARRKADQLAATLGSSIAGVLYVEDQSQYGSNPQPSLFIRGGRSEVLGLQAGVISTFPGKQMSVNGSVRVIFELGRKQ